MKKIVGIDFGLRRIGIAISDEQQKLSFPKGNINFNKDIDKVILELKVLINLDDVEHFVVGLPLSQRGNETPMSLNAKEFAKNLEKITGIKVELFDERLTSKFAHNLLKESNMNRKKRAKHVDQVAAYIILQNFLDCKLL